MLKISDSIEVNVPFNYWIDFILIDINEVPTKSGIVVTIQDTEAHRSFTHVEIFDKTAPTLSWAQGKIVTCEWASSGTLISKPV